MSRAFNLTAEINLRGPANIRTVVADIRRQLGSIDVNINPRISPQTARNITRLNADLQRLNTTLTSTTSLANTASASIRNLGQSLNTIGSNNVLQNLNSTVTACQNLGRAAGGAGGNVGGAATQMEEFGRQSALAVRRFAAFSLAAGTISLFTRAVYKGVDAFIAFDKEFVRLQQVTGESAKSLQSLASEISRLSTGLGVASSDLTTVAVTLAQAGLSASDTRKALDALAKSSLAPSFDDMNETVEGSIALMRQFGIGAGDLESALGSINSVAAKFAVEASDIITAIQRTGGVFATASKGVSEGKDALNEFISVFTSVRQTTRESAETIATGLRTIFTRVQRGGTIEKLKEYGVVLTDLEGKFVGPYEAVKRLSEGLSQIDPRDIRFSQIVEELGGFRQIGKVIPLIQQFAVAQQALKVAQTGQASLAEDAATAQLSLANQLTKVREEFTALIRSVGESDSFRSFVTLSLQLASALIKLADSAKTVLPALTAIATIRGASALFQYGSGFGRGLGGGGARRFASGGMVPGSGNRDTVPAMLTPGEFVIRKKAVEAIGAGRLHSMNKYANGGIVQKFAQKNTPASAGQVKPLTQGQVERISSLEAKERIGSITKPQREELSKLKSALVSQGVLKKVQTPKQTKATFALAGLFGSPYDINAMTPQSKTPVRLVAGVLPEKESLKYQDMGLEGFKQTILRVGSKMSQSIGATVDSSENNLDSIIRNTGLGNIIGSILEGSLSLAGAPFFPKTRESSSIDFPLGLGSIASKFNLPGTEPTDATRTVEGGGLRGKTKKEFLGQVDRFLLKNPITVKKANGGSIQDTVPALLTPGEFVINKQAAQKLGSSTLHSLNRADKISGFNKGGAVGHIQKFFFGGRPRNVPAGGGWTGNNVTPLSNFGAGPRSGMDMSGTLGLLALAGGGTAVDAIGNAIGDKVAGAVTKSFGSDLLNFGAIGSTLGSFFGPQGAFIGAVLGGAIGLGKALYNYADTVAEAQKQITQEKLDKTAQQASISSLAFSKTFKIEDRVKALKDLEQTGKLESELFSQGKFNSRSQLGDMLKTQESAAKAAETILISEIKRTGKTFKEVSETLDPNELQLLIQQIGEGSAEYQQALKERAAKLEAAKNNPAEQAKINAEYVDTLSKISNEAALLVGLTAQSSARQKAVNQALDNIIDRYRRVQGAIENFGNEIDNIKNNVLNNIKDFEGGASVPEVNRSGEKVLANIRGSSDKQIGAVADTLKNVVGGEVGQTLASNLQVSKTLIDKLPSILESVPTNDVSTAKEYLKANIEGIPQVLLDDIGDSIQETINANKDKTIKEIASDPELLSKANKNVEESNKTAAEAIKEYNDSLQAVTDLQNKYIDTLSRADEYQRKAIDIRLNSEMDLKKLYGQNISLQEANEPFNKTIRDLTDGAIAGGTTDPNKIAQIIKDAEAEALKLQEAKQTIPENDKKAIDDNTKAYTANRLKLKNATDALKLVADNASRAANALSKIAEKRQRLDNLTNSVEQLLVSGPEDVLKFNQQAQAFAASRNAGLDFFKDTRNRQLAFGGLNQIKDIMGDEAYRNARADLVEKSLRANVPNVEAEFANRGQSFKDYIENIRTGKISDEDPVVKQYKQIMQDTIGANQELSKILKDQAVGIQTGIDTILSRLANELPQIIKNAYDEVKIVAPGAPNEQPKPPVEAAKSSDSKPTEPLITIDDKPRVVVPERITPSQKWSGGGVVYASKGQMINFQPKGTDTVPAMLTPGEFVINKDSTKANMGLLEAINNSKTQYASRGGVIYAANGGMVTSLKPDPEIREATAFFKQYGTGVDSGGPGTASLEEVDDSLFSNQDNLNAILTGKYSMGNVENMPELAKSILQSEMDEKNRQLEYDLYDNLSRFEDPKLVKVDDLLSYLGQEHSIFDSITDTDMTDQQKSQAREVATRRIEEMQKKYKFTPEEAKKITEDHYGDIMDQRLTEEIGISNRAQAERYRQQATGEIPVDAESKNFARQKVNEFEVEKGLKPTDWAYKDKLAENRRTYQARKAQAKQNQPTNTLQQSYQEEMQRRRDEYAAKAGRNGRLGEVRRPDGKPLGGGSKRGLQALAEASNRNELAMKESRDRLNREKTTLPTSAVIPPPPATPQPPPEVKPPVTPEVKPPVTPEVKPPVTPPPPPPEVKPPVTPEVKPPAAQSLSPAAQKVARDKDLAEKMAKSGLTGSYLDENGVRQFIFPEGTDTEKQDRVKKKAEEGATAAKERRDARRAEQKALIDLIKDPAAKEKMQEAVDGDRKSSVTDNDSSFERNWKRYVDSRGVPVKVDDVYVSPADIAADKRDQALREKGYTPKPRPPKNPLFDAQLGSDKMNKEMDKKLNRIRIDQEIHESTRNEVAGILKDTGSRAAGAASGFAEAGVGGLRTSVASVTTGAGLLTTGAGMLVNGITGSDFLTNIGQGITEASMDEITRGIANIRGGGAKFGENIIAPNVPEGGLNVTPLGNDTPYLRFEKDMYKPIVEAQGKIVEDITKKRRNQAEEVIGPEGINTKDYLPKSLDPGLLVTGSAIQGLADDTTETFTKEALIEGTTGAITALGRAARAEDARIAVKDAEIMSINEQRRAAEAAIEAAPPVNQTATPPVIPQQKSVTTPKAKPSVIPEVKPPVSFQSTIGKITDIRQPEQLSSAIDETVQRMSRYASSPENAGRMMREVPAQMRSRIKDVAIDPNLQVSNNLGTFDVGGFYERSNSGATVGFRTQKPDPRTLTHELTHGFQDVTGQLTSESAMKLGQNKDIMSFIDNPSGLQKLYADLKQEGILKKTYTAEQIAKEPRELLTTLMQFEDTKSFADNIAAQDTLRKLVEASGYKAGGLVASKGYSSGGKINPANGLYMPGMPGRDDMIAKVGTGEFITNESSTKKYRPLLEAINRSKGGPIPIPGFADGTSSGGGSTKSTGGFNGFSIDLSNESKSSMDKFIIDFGSYVDKLSNISLPTVPDTIEMTGNHVVDVRVTGAAAFESLQDGIKNMIDTKINEKMGEIWTQSGGQLGKAPSLPGKK